MYILSYLSPTSPWPRQTTTATMRQTLQGLSIKTRVPFRCPRMPLEKTEIKNTKKIQDGMHHPPPSKPSILPQRFSRPVTSIQQSDIYPPRPVRLASSPQPQSRTYARHEKRAYPKLTSARPWPTYLPTRTVTTKNLEYSVLPSRIQPDNGPDVLLTIPR